MIKTSDIQFVKQCLESYYAHCPQTLPDVPNEMRDGVWEEDDWVRWKLIESRLTEADVLDIENELPFRLPPLFQAFLVTYHVLDMDFGAFHLPELPSDKPLEQVRQYLFRTELWDIGYAQFASGESGDPVCFDLQAPMPDGEFKVVVINHDNIPRPADWLHREAIEPHAEQVANSFRDFFIGLCLRH
jgi:hypothetical protein